MLVSDVQQSDSVKYIYIYIDIYVLLRILSSIGFYEILKVVPCAI